MTASQIGSLLDAAIPALCGLIVLFTRGKMISKIADQNKRERTKKILGFAGSLLMLSGLMLGVSSWSTTKKGDVLADAVAIINSKAPRMIDDVTRFEGATAEDGRRLVCRVTFTTQTRSEIDEKMWEEQIAPMIRERLKSTPAVEAALEEDITVIYRYFGSDGLTIGDVVFEPENL